MPRRIETLIEESHWELPRECFSVTPQTPWSERGRVISRRPEGQLGDLSRVTADAPPEPEQVRPYDGLAEGEIAETWPGDPESFDQAIRTFGFEALAVYVSFHAPLPDGTWGVFFLKTPMQELVRKVVRDLDLPGQLAEALAFNMVRAHELVHFRFDVCALGEELTLVRPMYLPYQQRVYEQVLYTNDCWEESLANAGALQRARNVDGPTARAAPPRVPWPDFVYDLCKASPPGYSNVDIPKEEMKSHLGGQLAFTDAAATVPPASAIWVATSQTFAPDDACPQFIVENNGVVRSRTRLTIRTRTGPWVLHRYDKDPWPSTPHAHHCQTGEKLDLSTGDVWGRNRQRTRRLSRRDLEAIRGYVEASWPDVQMPVLAN